MLRLLSLTLGLILCAMPAYADGAVSSDYASQPVLEREYNGFKPLGVQLNSFLLKGSIASETAIDTNIYRTNTGAQADIYQSVRPDFRLESQWRNHGLIVDGDIEFKRYLDNNTENEDNVRLNIEGFLDVNHKVQLFNRAGILADHEERRDIRGTRSPVEPFRRLKYEYAGGARYAFNKVSLEAELGIEAYRFDDGQARNTPGQRAVRSDADRNTYSMTLSGAYDVTPDRRALAQMKYLDIHYLGNDYVQATDTFSGPTQNVKAYAGLLGLQGKIFRQVKGKVLAGVEYRTFDNQNLDDVVEQIFDVGLYWNPTPIGTLRLDYLRNVEQDNGIDGGFTRNSLGLAYDHELRRNLRLTGLVDYEHRDYESVTRTDKTLTLSQFTDYSLSPEYSLGTEITYRDRNSNLNAAEFEQWLIMLALKYHL